MNLFPEKNGALFHSYVELPEGIWKFEMEDDIVLPQTLLQFNMWDMGLMRFSQACPADTVLLFS